MPQCNDTCPIMSDQDYITLDSLIDIKNKKLDDKFIVNKLDTITEVEPNTNIVNTKEQSFFDGDFLIRILLVVGIFYYVIKRKKLFKRNKKTTAKEFGKRK